MVAAQSVPSRMSNDGSANHRTALFAPGGSTLHTVLHRCVLGSRPSPSVSLRVRPGMCRPPYRRLTLDTPGAFSATARHSVATSLRRSTSTGTSAPPPTAPLACALTIICANAKRLAAMMFPPANESSNAPSTGAGLPPPQTQSSKSRCASGHGTSQQTARVACRSGPPPARPFAVTTSASSAGDAGTDGGPGADPSPVPGDASPASACRRASSCLGMSATYQLSPHRSSASSCGTRKCVSASRRASGVGASATASCGRNGSRRLRSSSSSSSSSSPSRAPSRVNSGALPSRRFSSPVMSSKSTAS
mmetsp:Transcript_9260/g.37421  ORF Transcript_9260/g.37421 Transcript_9260/m.37421 type:complete len:306 (+) Transcript_9260:1210-2127(+)